MSPSCRPRSRPAVRVQPHLAHRFFFFALSRRDLNRGHLDWYYGSLAVLMLFNIGWFHRVSRQYVKRAREHHVAPSRNTTHHGRGSRLRTATQGHTLQDLGALPEGASVSGSHLGAEDIERLRESSSVFGGGRPPRHPSGAGNGDAQGEGQPGVGIPRGEASAWNHRRGLLLGAWR